MLLSLSHIFFFHPLMMHFPPSMDAFILLPAHFVVDSNFKTLFFQLFSRFPHHCFCCWIYSLNPNRIFFQLTNTVTGAMLTDLIAARVAR
jgi:hypothetical protein